jgi:hypothetical protein
MVNLLTTILIDVLFFVIAVMYIDIQLVIFNNKELIFYFLKNMLVAFLHLQTPQV